MSNILNFESDANSETSEYACKILLERLFPGITIDVVGGKHLKYDLIVTKGIPSFPKGTTIDVKENYNTTYNNIYLEAINNGWNGSLTENDYNIETYITNDPNIKIKSWGWAFQEHMKDTDYILFLDKQWQNKNKKGNRVAYLIPKEEIAAQVNEEAIKNGTHTVIWNKISSYNGRQWRSAYIKRNIRNFDDKLKISF